MTEQAKSWRCFFCDEVFTDPREAQVHFGAEEHNTVACKIMPHQQKIMEYIRYLETTIRSYIADRHADSHPLLQSVWVLQAQMDQKVRAAEEQGFARGVQAMRAQGFCPEPEKHK